MSYVNPDFKSKKELVTHVKDYVRYTAREEELLASGKSLEEAQKLLREEFPKRPRALYPYNPSGCFEPPQNGTDTIEGPHYPKPHKWYARVQVKDGIVVKVIS